MVAGRYEFPHYHRLTERKVFLFGKGAARCIGGPSAQRRGEEFWLFFFFFGQNSESHREWHIVGRHGGTCHYIKLHGLTDDQG